MKNSWLTYCITLLLALALSLVIFYFMRHRITMLLYRLVALGICTAVLFRPIFWLLSSVIWPRLAPFPSNILIVWSIVCLVIGFLLTIVVAKNLPQTHTLEIIATGQKNAAAKGSEVWVIGRRHDFGNNLDTPDLISDGLWEKRGRDLVSYRQQPAKLEWIGKLKYDGALWFLQHPWSGIVEILWDKHSQEIDLYSENRGYKKIVLPAKIYTLTRIVFEGALFITLSFSYFVISVLIIALPPKAHHSLHFNRS